MISLKYFDFFVFFLLIYLGTRVVESFNNILIIGLIVSYLLFIGLGIPFIKGELLSYYNMKKSLIGLPIIFAAFAYQGIIPTIVFYLRKNGKVARLVVIIGSSIPLVIYIVWQVILLGVIPREEFLFSINQGESVVITLQRYLQNKSFVLIGQAFAFCALMSSLLGVTLGLRDFLADGLHIKKDTRGKIFLCGLIFIPPLVFSSYLPPALSSLRSRGNMKRRTLKCHACVFCVVVFLS